MRFFLAALLLLSGLSHAGPYEGRVVGVSDGDSITVLDSAKRQHKGRLAGIDAPELKQAFGQASKRSLSALVFGKTVVVETEKRDRYDRQIGKVLVEGRESIWHKLKRVSPGTISNTPLSSRPSTRGSMPRLRQMRGLHAEGFGKTETPKRLGTSAGSSESRDNHWLTPIHPL